MHINNKQNRLPLKRKIRRSVSQSKGSAIVALMGIFMTFVVLVVGMLGFEFARYQLAITQLKAVLDAASLAGASMLAGAYTQPQTMPSNPNNNPTNSPTWQPSANWPPPGTNTNQWNAMQAVNNIFTMNSPGSTPSAIQSVMGIMLNGNTTPNYDVTQMSLASPGAGKFNLNIGWVSSVTDQPTSPSDPNAKILSASATMGYQPAFAKFFGLTNNFVMSTAVQSRASVSMLDLAICFDLSESMDDQTPMILVERYQNPYFNGSPPLNGSDNANLYNVPQIGTPKVAYNTASAMANYYNPTGDSIDTLPLSLYYFGQGLNGSPQYLGITGTNSPWDHDYYNRYYNYGSSYGTPATDFNTYHCTWWGVSNPHQLLQLGPVSPGPNHYKYPNSITQQDPNFAYTDAVVDLFNSYEFQSTPKPTYPTPDFASAYPGTFTTPSNSVTLPATFQGAGAGSTFSFPDVPTLVEAARGNLESTQVAQAAGLNTLNPSVKPYFKPQAGYYNAYMFAALQLRLPLTTGEAAVQDFIKTLNTDVDVHFCFIPFESNAYDYYTNNGFGNNSVSGVTGYDFGQSNSGNGWILPGIGFNATVGSAGSNYDYIYNVINPIPYNTLTGATTNPYNAETGVTSTSSSTFQPSGDAAFLNTMSDGGGTNISDALTKALNQFNSTNSRIKKGAKAACILFTDGEPTAGPWPTGAAQQLGQAGVVLYAVALAQIPAIQTSQQSVMNQIIQANNQQGSEAFFIAPGSASQQQLQLQQAFANIERSLISLTQ